MKVKHPLVKSYPLYSSVNPGDVFQFMKSEVTCLKLDEGYARLSDGTRFTGSFEGGSEVTIFPNAVCTLN